MDCHAAWCDIMNLVYRLGKIFFENAFFFFRQAEVEAEGSAEVLLGGDVVGVEFLLIEVSIFVFRYHPLVGFMVAF